MVEFLCGSLPSVMCRIAFGSSLIVFGSSLGSIIYN
jgi:hypothetical protein